MQVDKHCLQSSLTEWRLSVLTAGPHPWQGQGRIPGNASLSMLQTISALMKTKLILAMSYGQRILFKYNAPTVFYGAVTVP
jgi:hypothetical protein